MTELGAQVKRDEEYPLLKVESGGGDNVLRSQAPTTIAASGWHVTCTPKQSWCSRWPEFVSACWMTIILLAISFLVFCALGMSAYRRQPVVVVKCNDTKPASEVFYHHIIPRDAHVPLSIFSEYLSHMARQYPLLRINVNFLIDDSWQNSFQDSRLLSARLLNRLIPPIARPFSSIFGLDYKREIRDFQRIYENVNISVMVLSKYMARTPLRYKWRTIPPNYLSFYARIYAIWQYGGIGFDFVTFNNQFHRNQAIDSRLDAILKQHNDGIRTEAYADNTFNYPEIQAQTEIFSMFFNIVNQILNETSLFFGADNQDIKELNNTPLVRTHRIKRDIAINKKNTTVNFKIENRTNSNNLNHSNNITEKIKNLTKNISKENNDSNYRKGLDELMNQHEVFHHLLRMQNDSKLNVDVPQVVLFYDVIGFSDDVGPSYSYPKTFAPADLVSIKGPSLKYATIQGQSKPKYLSLTPEGHFIAASSRHHPFLAQLFSSGCQRFSPQFAIKDTLLSQCSGIRDDVYCDNIRVLYDVV
ncbi:uncharacterized protein LOC112048152 [Bicyclus anynana]|uniref:Uncharacterized protein LOC112048152 n=1 Tax=Bicyclus anynana TaxID=110368 RepID=A0A6J1NE12_BICAN|nr:uncharacterized protein LOC112048152 [Bicyclus anynana]